MVQLHYLIKKTVVNDIEKIKCSDGEMYFDKCDRAIARDKNYRKRIAQNLIDKQGEQYLLRSKTMKTLIKEYGANKVLGDEVTKNQLLVFMLRHGYIDDTYQMYINYFLPGSITVDELNFILNVRNYVGKTDWNNRVIHPNNVVSRLFDYELEQQKECLNFDLADYFYKDDKKSDKKTGFTKLLAKNDIDSKEFIKEYYVRANNKAEYIKNIAQQKLLFWYDICSDDSLVYKDKILYLKDIFMYLDIDDIVLQDTQADDKDPAYSICSFIVGSDGVLELLQEAGAQKVVEVLIKVKAKLRNIDLDTVIPEIVRGIYENELFEISFLMLQKYVDFRIGEHVQDFRKNIFTFILGQEDVYVIKYLERNIQEFVSKIILPIEDNTNEDIDTVFRCIQLLDYDEKFSIQLVQKMDVVMKNLSEWISSTTDQKKDVRKIVDAFLVEDKIEASIDNLDTYKTKYQFSIELCKFVDRNIDALLADKNIDDAHVKEFLKKDIKEETVEKILQNYEMESFSDELNIYRDNVIRTMILLKYFKYTRSRYYEICSAFPGMFSLFVEHYWNEFETEIPNISVDLKIIDEVMKSNLKDEKKVIFLSKVDAIQMTDEMYAFVCKTDIKIPKKYLLATWNKLDVRDRPAFMVKHFSVFSIVEIQNMFAQMPEEYHALKQTYSRHEVLLEKNGINDSLCKKLLQTYYISSYDTKKVRSDLLTGDVEKYVARVNAKKRV